MLTALYNSYRRRSLLSRSWPTGFAARATAIDPRHGRRDFARRRWTVSRAAARHYYYPTLRSAQYSQATRTLQRARGLIGRCLPMFH
jgi:hypothetical protein